ncbi:MAG: nuclear transport factor 2 family protein [Chlamydiales bacterium]|nr:nuclear transport factor 2 family protein [Chlamydiales bacterium]
MSQNNVAIAEAFYAAMANKDLATLAEYLHPDVYFRSPFVQSSNAAGYLEAARKFVAFFTSLTVRNKIASDNQVVVIYDIGFPAPIGNIPTAAWLTFNEGLVTKIELFFDTNTFRSR